MEELIAMALLRSLRSSTICTMERLAPGISNALMALQGGERG